MTSLPGLAHHKSATQSGEQVRLYPAKVNQPLAVNTGQMLF
nr:MAG TPA: hypothetical protein [Caudoviricetes sp.]